MFVLPAIFCYFAQSSRSTKDFAALRCHEKQIVKLADLIKTALNEVGCEELPSGCDDISVDPSFIENNICNNDQQSVSVRQAVLHSCRVTY